MKRYREMWNFDAAPKTKASLSWILVLDLELEWNCASPRYGDISSPGLTGDL
jgi:hypothetical protein